MVDVYLTLMPYASPAIPSLALSLLKACLAGTEIRATVGYPNLFFASEIGDELYMDLAMQIPGGYQLGEWTFAYAAFRELIPDDAGYLAEMETIIPAEGLISEKAMNGQPVRDLLLGIREEATALVERTAQSILDLNPRIVGCSSSLQQRCSSLAVLRRIHELNPDVITLMGGFYCEGSMGIATRREFPWVDYIFSGEAESIFLEFCRTLLNYGRDVPSQALPHGVIDARFVAENGDKEAPRANILNMDDQPLPDYDDYFHALHEAGLDLKAEHLPVETSRGCWWGEKSHCTFCGFNSSSMTFRSKSAERALEDLALLSQRYKTTKFLVVDNILNVEYLKSLLPKLVDLGAPYSIFYEVKANLKRKDLELLAAAGVRSIQPGLENFHDQMLKLIRKGTTSLVNVRLLKWARDLGIWVGWLYLVDIPGDRDQWYHEVAEWIPWISHLQPPYGTLPIQFVRFSPYHMQPEDFGLKLSPLKWYGYIFPIPPKAMSDFACDFQANPLSLPTPDNEWRAARRPGVEKLKQEISSWKELHGAGVDPPILEMAEDGDRLIIEDTRPCAVMDRHVLTGPAARLYTLCEQGCLPATLCRALGLGWDEIQPIVSDLESRGLLLELSKKYLSLAVQRLKE